MTSLAKQTFFEGIRTRCVAGESPSSLVLSGYPVSTFGKIHSLEKHSGCINTVNWNESGTKLVTGSDDRTVNIWSTTTFECLITLPTGHRNNVFCATFVPASNDEQIVTCAADGCVHLMNVESGERDILFESAFTGYCFKHCMDPSNPSSTGLVTISDGSVVRFDLRSKTSIEVLNIRQDFDLRQLSLGRFSTPPSGTDIKFNPIDPNIFALGTSTRAVLLFDTRNLSSCGSKIIPEFTKRQSESFPGEAEAVSGLDWDKRNGLIVNYCRQSVIEVDAGRISWNGEEGTRYRVGRCPEIPRQWIGRVNHQTFLKEVALIGDGRYVATGGDCGNLFIWDRFENDQKLILKKPADPYVLNCIAPHPYLPLFATSGIASVADVWETFGAEPEDVETELQEETEESGTEFVQREEVTVDEGRERLAAANVLRAQGNQAFGEANFQSSLVLYRQACSLLEFQCGGDAALTRQRRDALEKCHTNKAASLMGLSRWIEAVDACDEALDLNPTSYRALIRRSKCYLRLGNMEAALEDLERVLLSSPTDSEALVLLDQLHERLDTQHS